MRQPSPAGLVSCQSLRLGGLCAIVQGPQRGPALHGFLDGASFSASVVCRGAGEQPGTGFSARLRISVDCIENAIGHRDADAGELHAKR